MIKDVFTGPRIWTLYPFMVGNNSDVWCTRILGKQGTPVNKNSTGISLFDKLMNKFQTGYISVWVDLIQLMIGQYVWSSFEYWILKFSCVGKSWQSSLLIFSLMPFNFVTTRPVTPVWAILWQQINQKFHWFGDSFEIPLLLSFHLYWTFIKFTETQRSMNCAHKAKRLI